MFSLILVAISLCIIATRGMSLPISSEYTESRVSAAENTAPAYSPGEYASTERNPGVVYDGTPPAVLDPEPSKGDKHFYMLPSDIVHGAGSEIYGDVPTALYCYRNKPKAEQISSHREDEIYKGVPDVVYDVTPLSATPLSHGLEPNNQFSYGDLPPSDAPLASEAPPQLFRSTGHPHNEGGFERLEHLMRTRNNERGFERLFYNNNREVKYVPILLFLHADSVFRGHQSDARVPSEATYATAHAYGDHVPPYRNLDMVYKVLAQENRVSAPLAVSATVPVSEPTPAFTTTSDQPYEELELVYGFAVLEQPEAEGSKAFTAATTPTEQDVVYGEEVVEPPQEEGNGLSRYMSCQCLPVA